MATCEAEGEALREYFCHEAKKCIMSPPYLRRSHAFDSHQRRRASMS